MTLQSHNPHRNAVAPSGGPVPFRDDKGPAPFTRKVSDMTRSLVLTGLGLALLAACDYPDERVGSLACTNVSPVAAASMTGTSADPLHCGPQSQPITAATMPAPGSVVIAN